VADSDKAKRNVFIIGVLALLAVGVAPYVLDTYTVNIMIRALLYAALALTVDILWGYTGILTFGQSAFFGIGAYACALIFSHYGFGPGWAIFALLLGILAAMAVAALVGWLAFYHGASPLYASIVTLALPIVLTQIVFSGGRFTGSSSGLSGFPTYYWSLEVWFWIAGVFLVLVTCAAWLFVRSDFGRILIAIRENEDRCAYLGIPVSPIKIALMVAMGAIGAIAGFGYAAFTNVVAPELTGFLLGTELLIWVALGGRATLIGPVLGAILIDVSSSYLSGSLPFVWKLLVGIAFVIVIVALPQGLLPGIVQLLRRLFGRAKDAGEHGKRTAVLQPTDTTTLSAAPAATAALEINGLQKHYGSLTVLDGIAYQARAGELLSIVGPNGAGKTTLMRCISDGYERSSGQVLINGHTSGRLPPQKLVAFGIGRSFQTTSLFETLTVAECLRIARYRLQKPSLWGRSNTLELPEAALQVIKATGLEQRLGTEARYLPHGLKRALELSMVLALEPSILLLDEPTAGLIKSERTLIGNILVNLAREHNLCILLIEHDLDFVREISSRVIVLHQGKVMLDGSVQEVVDSDLVHAIYAGHAQPAGAGA
jgi:branched-chain amino acid transport system permease protein